MLLFLTTNMAAVTSRANQQSPHSYNNNNNHGNFICVFERTIVNLATYRQIGWLKTKQNKTKAKQTRKEIKIALKGLCQLESIRSEVMQITFNCQNSIVLN